MGEEEFRKALVSITKKVKQKPEMSEGDVYSCFVGENFFGSLGYKNAGIDYKAQERIGMHPADYDCLDDLEQSIFILEAKKPTEEDLLAYRDKQLKEKYVLPKKSRYGVLSNGIKFYVFKREGETLVEVSKIEDLQSVSQREAQSVYSLLRKPSYEYSDLSKILEEISKIEPKPLTEEINRKSFYEIFQLRQEVDAPPTKFTRLVYALMNLFDELLKEEKSEFLEGAYKFWLRSYAHKPSKLPENWKNLEKLAKEYENEATLYKFMFCLETAHNIVAKVILAKVCEDVGFKNVSALEKLKAYMGLEFGEERIKYVAYPFAIKRTFDALRSSLVESIFEEDIFDWWIDCKIRVGESALEWRSKPNWEVESFGEALARIFFALRTFNFSEVHEDLLGELYQHYFDPETRKALGEFYTPIEVVDYILDAVGYNSGKILNQRLLDPATGSGTFVVEALKRYFSAAKENRSDSPEYWCGVLKNLCDKPKIIGLDINPFACLMAQIRFMMEIVLYYKLAKEENPDFVLTTIPIFRTDSLEIETKTGRMQTQLGEFKGDVMFSMSLPILEKEDKFYEIKLFIPSWDKLRELLGNKDDYFLALRLAFNAVKEKARKQSYEITPKELKEEFQKGNIKSAEQLASVMQEYVERILTQIKHLVQVWKDGRLVKSVEDLVLAGVLKNFFLYDYVVGNPPYVRQERIVEQKKNLEETYPEVYDGRADLYIYFFGRGINQLNKKGYLGFISSNKFITRGYGKNVRKYISAACQIKVLIDFGDSGVFKDAVNYPCIIIIQKKESNEPLQPVSYVEVYKEPTHLEIHKFLQVIKNIINEGKEFVTDDFQFSIAKHPLSSSIWQLRPEQRNMLMGKIEASCTHRLANICEEIQMGQQSNADTVHIVTEQTINQFKLEFSLLKKLIRGEGIKRWQLSWNDEYLIFPYKQNGGSDSVIGRDEIFKNYPNIWKWFNLEDNKKILENRSYLMEKIKTGERKEFYELWIPKASKLYENPKILTPDISPQNNFVYDEEGFFVPTTGFVITLLHEFSDKKDYQFILGLLNSKVLEFYYKQIAPSNRGRYYRYNKSFLEQLPIHLPQTPEKQKLADEITSLVEKILSLAKVEQKVQSFPEPYFEELKQEIEEWDEITWRAKRSYKSIEPIVEEGAIVLGKGDEIKDVKINFELKQRYVVEALKGKSVSKDEEIKVRLPRSEAAIRKMQKRLEEDKARLKEKSIAELEKEVNERVYRLYGLNETDVKVIDEFLRKF